MALAPLEPCSSCVVVCKLSVVYTLTLAQLPMEPWSNCVVVCRLCHVYNMTKFWL